MGAIEFIEEFDPFLHEHLEKCKNEKVNATYLSKPVYEELIEIMGKHVQDEIVNQINNLDTKYYSIIVDSTPDLTHVDQLIIVVRYCYNGKPCERFLTFLPIESHSSTTLFNEIQQVLGEHKLSLENRIAHYESEAKGLVEDITSSYSDASKRIVTRKFSDGTSGIASLRGADKFRIEVLYQPYDCLIIQLRKRIDPYEQIAKRFKFLSELVNNSEIDEDSIKLIISYYKDDIDHKLVNECYQFKEYLHLRKSQNTEENTPSKMQCAEVLQLICEQHLIEAFPNITTSLKLYLTMPIMSCEAERNFISYPL
ncbi:hypothetical protein scyTo_0024748 [Scyliorhinus torazame]|uniref:Uncharacterized protein n=1 Tax=Scyliorhinus torazame TaxID=75743 RepID=A0A401QEX1_SCYTO|nr:hypothetical protein [Scyliorhinus torazame]